MKLLFILKKILRITALLIAVLFILLVCNSLNNARIIDYPVLSDGLKEKIDQATALVKKAKQEMRPSQPQADGLLNGWAYRFDEHSNDAKLSAIAEMKFEPSKDILFDFNNSESLIISPSGGRFEAKKGTLAWRHSLDNILTNHKMLSIPRDAIGDIELKLKVTRCDELQLSWSSSPDAGIDDYGKIEQMKIATIPDGQFHVYRVPGLVMASWLHGRDRTIRKIYLSPMDPEIEDDIEIDYIRFAPRDEKFAVRPFGVDYEKINAEMRKILYLHSGHELRYQLTIPSDRPVFFKCGIGTLKETRVTLFASIELPEGHKELISDDFEGQSGWLDIKLDLSRFAGRDVTFIFRAEADTPNVIFISSPILYSPPRQKQTIIIVLEDALRADRMSCYGNQRKTTPYKDQWCQEGIRFQNAFSQSSFTRSSCTSLLTSLYPSATGVWNNSDRLSNNYQTLAELLYRQGIATALFSQNTNVGPFSGLHQGFDTVIDNETIGKRAPGIYESETLKKWLADHADQNTFIFIHVLDPHYPFNPPEEVSAPYRDKDYLFGKLMIPHDKLYDPPWLKRVTFESRNFLYDEEIRYNDLSFPALLKILKDQGIYDETLMLFIADHGEHMGEHYLWNHQPPNYQRVLHVPMLMVYPRLFPAGVTISQPVQLLDIAPTLLDIAGVNLNDLLIQGDSLLPYIQGKTSWSRWDQRVCLSDEVRFSSPNDTDANGGIFFKNFHVMTSDRHADLLSHQLNEADERLFNLVSRTQVFDIKKDPDETFTLVNFLADWYFTSRMKDFHNQFRRINLELHSHIAKDSEKTVIYDNTTIEQLKSLGYIK